MLRAGLKIKLRNFPRKLGSKALHLSNFCIVLLVHTIPISGV